MTSWGWLILVSAVFLGLRRQMPPRQRYLTAVIIAVFAVVYAAVRQHAY